MGTVAGIQSVDIFPNTDTGPFLADGDELAAPQDLQPVQMDRLMGDAAKLLDGIAPDAVGTLGHRAGCVVRGSRPDPLRIDRGRRPDQHAAGRAGPTVAVAARTQCEPAGTMSATGDSFVRGTGAARTFTEQLDTSGPVLLLLDQSPAALNRTRACSIAITIPSVRCSRTSPRSLRSYPTEVTLSRPDSTDPRGTRQTRVDRQGGSCAVRARRDAGTGVQLRPGRRAVGDLTPAEPNLTLYCPPGESIAQRGSRTAPRPDDLGLQNAPLRERSSVRRWRRTRSSFPPGRGARPMEPPPGGALEDDGTERDDDAANAAHRSPRCRNPRRKASPRNRAKSDLQRRPPEASARPGLQCSACSPSCSRTRRLQWWEQRQLDTLRDQAVETTRDYAQTVASFDYQNLDANRDKIAGMSTSEFTGQYNKMSTRCGASSPTGRGRRRQPSRTRCRERGRIQCGRPAFVDQEAKNVVAPEGKSQKYRMVVTLERDGDRWIVDNVETK